jgi:hypothetical protein
VVLVVEAMWCWLRRLCVGLTENKANSASKLSFSTKYNAFLLKSNTWKFCSCALINLVGVPKMG